VALGLCACCAPDDSPLPPDLTEVSVREGMNDRFLRDDVDVAGLVNAFEGESREIAACRAGIVRALELRPGMVVADVGAGTGLFMEPFAEAVGPKGRVLELDISPGLVEFMADRAREAGWTQVEARLCGERSVDLPRNSVDLVFVCDTYHHFEFPHSTLATILHALRPGGKLVIVDFERVPGRSSDWILRHVRLGKEETIAEVESAGFRYLDEAKDAGLRENYLIRFTAP